MKSVVSLDLLTSSFIAVDCHMIEQPIRFTVAAPKKLLGHNLNFPLFPSDKHCCQFNDFVARFSDFSYPFIDFFFFKKAASDIFINFLDRP